MSEFSKEARRILKEVAREVEEFHVDFRKGKSQSKYVMEVKAGDEYWHLKKEDFFYVPEHLVGTWMMTYAGDLEYTNLDEAIDTYDWVKCEEVEVVTKEWREVKYV